MFTVQTGVPRLRVHMRNRRRRHDDLLPGQDPALNIDIHPIWHSDDVEMHPEAQSLGVDGLEHWQAE